MENKNDLLKIKIVYTLALGLVIILLVVVIGDYVIVFFEDKEPSEGIINLLQSAITGIIGLIAGFIAGRPLEEPKKEPEDNS